MNAEHESRGSRSSANSAPSSKAAAIPRIDTRELLGGGREVVIVHAGREYRLRVTSNGKLILTA
jgi:hemin uptake protein HemP